MAGRPRALCETKQGEVCLLISTGCSVAAAARYVGCSVLTIQREARRNQAFREKLRCSSVSAELSPIRTMRSAATSEWRTAAWLLERTQPQHYAKRAADSFNREEVLELLGRVCEVVRQETRDPESFSRIRRRVSALTRNSIRSDVDVAHNIFRAQLASPPERTEDESELPPAAQESPTHTSAATQTSTVSRRQSESSSKRPEGDQNVTEMEPILICLADVPPGNSRGFTPQHASK